MKACMTTVFWDVFSPVHVIRYIDGQRKQRKYVHVDVRVCITKLYSRKGPVCVEKSGVTGNVCCLVILCVFGLLSGFMCAFGRLLFHPFSSVQFFIVPQDDLFCSIKT